MAKTYILNDFKNLKQMNIYYKSINGIYNYKEEYAVLIDDGHLCIVPNAEEATKLVRCINLNIAEKILQREDLNYDWQFTYNAITYEKVNVSIVGEALLCDLIMPKDIRINGSSLIPTKRLIKQFYAKAVKNGKKYEALDFNFKGLDSQLINEIVTAVLGASKPTSSQNASILNYEEKFKQAVLDFLDYENNESDSKEYTVNNDFVDCILQLEKAFQEIRPLRKSIVLHKSTNGIVKKHKVGNSLDFTAFVDTSLVEKDENYKNIVYYHLVVPRGTPFALVSQSFSSELPIDNENGVILPPSTYEVKAIDTDVTTRKTDIKLKYENQIDLRAVLKEAFRRNLENYVKENSNCKKSRDQYDKCKSKYKKFFDKNQEQVELLEVITKLPEASLNYILEQIEDIDYDKELFENEGEYVILHTKRLMLISSIYSYLEGLSNQDTKILIAASKYHDIGIQNEDEDEVHGRLSSKMITHELDDFEDADRDLIRFLIAEHDLSDDEIAEDFNNINKTKKSRFKTMLERFIDLIELEKVRNYKLDPTFLQTDSSKKMVKLAFDNWNLFETLFNYLLAETFAMSRLEDIKTNVMIEEEEKDIKKGVALVNLSNNKNSFLTKAINFLDRFRMNNKETLEENSAAAAKARLSKVMVGRQIAKEAEKK